MCPQDPAQDFYQQKALCGSCALSEFLRRCLVRVLCGYSLDRFFLRYDTVYIYINKRYQRKYVYFVDWSCKLCSLLPLEVLVVVCAFQFTICTNIRSAEMRVERRAKFHKIAFWAGAASSILSGYFADCQRAHHVSNNCVGSELIGFHDRLSP